MIISSLAGAIGNGVSAFDQFVLSLFHGIAVRDSGALAELSSFLGLATEKGILFLFLGSALLPFKKTREAGVMLIGAVLVSAGIAGALKELVARPRPFQAVGLFADWWRLAGSSPESGYSFPSGHATVSMAAAAALFFAGHKRVGLVALLGALAIGASRCCLFVHYPSDILAGFAVGFLGALAARVAVSRFTRRLKRRGSVSRGRVSR
ncbi:phosphoesterase PA-phosphatase related protein [Gracilinema caldarium DSM 7334]|uniref:Phosphoesterase PA-phosphatase related protein n=2 Tax=Gracilinema caldarium TaxID=215591 RepID=F8F1K5_GRAC1|nr:phosphoesterase PA-phosphatase related protein [Gracilinema caldarium DSM 7334]